MNPQLTKLASIGKQVTQAAAADQVTPTGVPFECSAGSELINLLRIKNGFYAFESALLLRPLSNQNHPLGIKEWNAPELWRDEYSVPLGDALFFAEDIFGGQFCVKERAIHYFDPETGRFERVSASLEEWAKLLLFEQMNYWTGYTLGHEWQIQNQTLPPGSRLLPKVPFVCDGKYAVENLYLSDDVT
jgi:hypothetical protein